MNGHLTLARPYAKALFSLACEEKQLEYWSNALQFLAMVAKDKTLHETYRDTRFSSSELSQIFTSLSKKANIYHQYLENLILLLAHYKRLALLPAIALLYEDLKASLEKTIQVTVTSAFPLSEKFIGRLKKALAHRLQRGVEIHCVEDRSLIGGAVIRAGDLVIDGSVKNKLEKLRQAVVD